MKRLNELKVGDPIYVGFDKKVITEIRKYVPNYRLDTICTNDGGQYEVHSYLPDDYSYKELVRVYADKEAIINHYKKELEDLRIEYENRKAHFEEQLERAKNLEFSDWFRDKPEEQWWCNL